MISCELDELAGTFRGCLVGGDFDFRRWGTAAMTELFPLWMLKYLPNMPACHIGIGQDARGPNNSITLGDVSSLSALAEGCGSWSEGQANVIIAGGVNARVHPAQWVRSRVLGLSRCRDPRAAPRLRPGSRRAGKRRGGGRVHRRDAGHGRSPQHRAVAGSSAMARSLPRPGQASRSRRPLAGQSPPPWATRGSSGDIGCVVAHACGGVEANHIEAEAIRAFGDVPVTAPKSFFGHLAPRPPRWRRPWASFRFGTGWCLPRCTTAARPAMSGQCCPRPASHVVARSVMDSQSFAARPGGGGGAGGGLRDCESIDYTFTRHNP